MMPPANLENTQSGLNLDWHGHFAPPNTTIFKVDRDFQDTEVELFRNIGHFYLKDVTIRGDALQADTLEGAAPPTFKASSGIFSTDSQNNAGPNHIGPPA